jgi:NSS family neurotransmitter:Na+ symporter
MIKDKFSRVGFILAAAGSAVGIGNIWKFPYLTGDNGGGAFVLVYLLTILLIGISVFIAESFIGYKTNKDSVSAFESLALKKQIILEVCRI